MARKRSLYVIFAFNQGGTGGELPPERPLTPLIEPVQKLLDMLARQYGASRNIADYQFLDWELQPIGPGSTIAFVPNPGVVFAVNAATPEDAARRGMISKRASMDSSALLLFIQTGRGTCECNDLVSNVSNAVKTKPGLFGTSIDLKLVLSMLWRRLIGK